MENAIECTDRRISQTEEKFYDLRDRLFENIQSEGKKEKTLRKNEHFLWDLWGIIKRANMKVIDTQEGLKKDKRIENLFKLLIAEKLSKPGERYKYPGSRRSNVYNHTQLK